jgi:microcystin-dependent protein
MSLNNVRALGDDRPWKDEVERELAALRDVLKFGKIELRASTTSSGGGGGGGGGADLSAITATLPATYDGSTFVIGVDEDAFTHISSLDYAEFDTTSTAADGVGILKWSQEFETFETKLDDNVTMHFGQDHLVRVKNASGSTAIPIMSVVMFAGATGDTVTVAPAVTDGSVSEDYIVGVTTEEIPADGFGFVTQFGFIKGVDTSAYTLGDLLWADPTVAGGLTTTAPVAPNLKLPLAAVTRVNASSGRVLVRAFVGKKLGELHDVTTTGATDGQVLAYNSTTGVWGPVDYFGGTVTSVDTGTGLTGGPITSSGTISLDASLDDLNDVVIATPATDQILKYDGTNWVNAAAPGGGGGTVTSITAGTGLSASPSSPITTSGTLNVTDAALNPSGMVSPFAGSSAPSGWLLCDGSAVSRTTYATLFGVVSTTYGVGDGSTTFNLPNLQGEVPVGKKAATSLGTATISIATPAVVTDTGHGLSNGQLIYFTTTGALPTGVVANTRYYVRNTTANTFNLSSTPTGAVINTSGSQSGTHTLFSADFADLGFGSGSVSQSLTIAELASHTHGPGVSTRFHGGNTSTSRTRFAAGSSGGFAFQSGTQSDLQESSATAATGSGLAHNNLQPYIVLNYIIKT